MTWGRGATGIKYKEAGQTAENSTKPTKNYSAPNSAEVEKLRSRGIQVNE